MTKCPDPGTWTALRADAERRSAIVGKILTPLRAAVLSALSQCDGPISAYQLTDRVNQRRGKVVAPISIYRSLDFLEEIGLAVKIASRQSYLFVAPGDHALSVLLICSTCDKLEVEDGRTLRPAMDAVMSDAAFAPDKRFIEVTGQCAACR